MCRSTEAFTENGESEKWKIIGRSKGNEIARNEKHDEILRGYVYLAHFVSRDHSSEDCVSIAYSQF